MFKWVTGVVAAIGLGVGIYTAATSRVQLPAPPPAQPPSVNPYPSGVAGTGIVEAATRNVRVAAPEPGVIIKIWKQVNDPVKAGEPLFELDARVLEADLIRVKAAQESATAELTRLEAQPRPEDLPPLRAVQESANVAYLDAKDQYERTAEIVKTNSASAGELTRRRFAMEQALAHLHQSQTELARAQAGAWEHDIAIARSKVAEAHAQVRALEHRIERLTVRSPIDGAVLKRNAEPGEMTDARTGEDAPMVVGDLSRLRVRAQVDESDAPLLRPGVKASARVRGRIDALLPLTMVRIEPLAIPKRQLAGAGSELVDTRVVEVLFQVGETGGVSIYPGQLVDVFIDVESPAAQAHAGRP